MPAKDKMAMKGEMCDCSHHKLFGWLVLVVGILYLLQDLDVISWMGWLNWWTVLFLLLGCSALCKCCGRGKWF